MIVQLTTPFDAGDFDSSRQYTHARIVSFQADIQNDRSVARFMLGYMDQGAFVPGIYHEKTFVTHEMNGEDGESFLAGASCVAFQQALCTAAIAGHVVEGTVV